MASSIRRRRTQDALERVRANLVAALHSGRLVPGDRAPSVRRLSDHLGLDPKTVHRAYRRLVTEGLLEAQEGSGTFVTEAGSLASGRPATSRLVLAVNRCRAEAAALRVDESHFGRFLAMRLDDGLRDVPLAIVECNREQVSLFGVELRRELGIRPRPALLDHLREKPTEVLAGVRGVVTTDFHRAEVRKIAEPFRIPIHRVALEPSVPRVLVEHAMRGPLVMVVSDRSFAPDFLRFLSGLGVGPEVRARVLIVEPREAGGAFRSASQGGAVYVSPLVEDALAGRVPERLRVVTVRRHLASASVERLRTRLAFDLSVGR